MLIDLSSDFALIAVPGDKADSFLQGQLTCDVRDITVNQTRLGAHCNPKGRVLSSFRVLKFQDTFYLLSPAVMAEPIIQQLQKYAVFSKVSLKLDNSLSILGWMGNENDQAMAYSELKQIPIQETLYPEDYSTRAYIIGRTESIMHLYQNTSLKGDKDLWYLEDIKAGITYILPETSGLFTPHMLDFPTLGAVSFKKGCYTGQEIIARTQYLGKSKRHIEKKIVKGDSLKPGDPFLDETQQVSGTVVACAQTKSENSSEQLVLIVQ